MTDLGKWLKRMPEHEALLEVEYKKGNIYYAVFVDKANGVTGVTLLYVFNRCGDEVTDDLNEDVLDFIQESLDSAEADAREQRNESLAMAAALEGR